MSQNQYEIRTLGELFGLSDEKIKNIGFTVNTKTTPLVPAVDTAYQFQQDHVRRLLLWIGGVAGRNLLITGPTGCGKSSLIEQLCSRLGRELYRVPCHGKLEFSELTGQLTVLPDGSTKFVHGPLPRAMQTGAVLMLDEMNFIHPSAIGALNSVLDGGPLLIPETGEIIAPHEEFRVVATGNSLDYGDDSPLYRGTQRMNLALIQRFLTLRADYLSTTDEALMLHRAVPSLPGNVVGVLAQVADDVRQAFKRGDIQSTVSTRTLVKWAKVLQARISVLAAQPEDELKFSLRFVLTDGLRPEDSKAVEGVLQRFSSGIVVTATPTESKNNSSDSSASAATASNKATKSSLGSGTLGTTVISFLVNPNRQNTGDVAFWVGIDAIPGKLGMSLNGTVWPQAVIRSTPDKEQAWIVQTLAEKCHTRGYTISHSLVVPMDEAEAVAREVVDVLSLFLVSARASKQSLNAVTTPTTISCRNHTTRQLAEEIIRQLGYSGVTVTV